ncbi:60S ribosomal protein L23A [Perkinsus chesapeaki]|uniref:60S ribosomal protein L23A n=2 Tax=Alveolata TaxID=33630 RepID=A0A7J6LCJ0_PERCH|nr:60S ribosomal protein L23A [Perkinsus chesapeaki]
MAPATDAKTKASKTGAALTKGVQVKTRKVRRNTHFFRPKTRQTPKAPKYPRSATPTLTKMDKYRIIRSPMTSEWAMKHIEDLNTLVFLCDVQASKKQIKDAVESLYDIKCKKVNTLVRHDGLKKAYVKLADDFDALDVGNRIGII